LTLQATDLHNGHHVQGYFSRYRIKADNKVGFKGGAQFQSTARARAFTRTS